LVYKKESSPCGPEMSMAANRREEKGTWKQKKKKKTDAGEGKKFFFEKDRQSRGEKGRINTEEERGGIAFQMEKGKVLRGSSPIHWKGKRGRGEKVRGGK